MKFIGGAPSAGYPKVYNILADFVHDGTNYATMTTDAWQKLDAVARAARVAAFKNFVSTIEDVLIDDIQTNTEYYSVEYPGARQIEVSGQTPLPYPGILIIVIHLPTNEFTGEVENPEEQMIGATESDETGRFLLLWEPTQAEYKRDEYPYIAVYLSAQTYAILPKPTFENAAANGIAFGAGDWV